VLELAKDHGLNRVGTQLEVDNRLTDCTLLREYIRGLIKSSRRSNHWDANKAAEKATGSGACR